MIDLDKPDYNHGGGNIAYKIPKPEKGEVLAAFPVHKDEVTAGYDAAAKRG
jgi:hypothetical protein